MKLDQDCVRELLLELEDKLTINNHLFLAALKKFDTFEKFGEDTSVYCILKLIEAGFIKGNVSYAANELYTLSVSSITWEGHIFLDSIRDNKIWSKTKEITQQLSSVSMTLMSSIAKDLLKNQFGL